MPLGFYIIMAAQFFSALADNALIYVAIALLREMSAPAGYEPLLKLFFTVSYVLLAAFVGAFADSMPKGRVMLIGNTTKILGCALVLFHIHPFYALAIVGLGAATYSPAKYGILTEYLPARKLVIANGWIEGLTVAAIILGAAMGGFLIRPEVTTQLQSWKIPGVDSMAKCGVLVIMVLYFIATVFNRFIPDTGVDHKPLKKNPLYLIHDFNHCFVLLWRDKLGQISLAVTTLFWGAGSTLQFIVIKWAEENLKLNLTQASYLQAMVGFGIALGAVLAASKISLRKSVKVIPLGVAMGLAVLLMIPVTHYWVAVGLIILVGALAGFFVVPMNALLQHRGHILMGAGHSIAVQNFNENLSILIMLGLYALLISLNLSIHIVIALFGIFVAVMMLLVKYRHTLNQRQRDEVSLLDDGICH